MDKLKFALFSVVVLSIVGVVGYWAVATIQSGSEHSKSAKIKQLEQENEDLRGQVEAMADELDTTQARLEEFVVKEEELAEQEAEPEVVVPDTYKHQTLISELEKLAKDKVFMKEGSRGSRVGTVQKFLNVFNKTSKKVDNDYGPGTVSDVKAFQKDQGLTSDGEAGAQTFNKMIDWLKEQG
jgi:murein L,D-transpeptidase YcbB/YkuD